MRVYCENVRSLSAVMGRWTAAATLAVNSPDDGSTITRRMVHVAAIGAIASLALTGCARLPEQKADAPPAPPVITQAQATEVMKNYGAVNNKANSKRDARLLATIEGGDLFVESAASYAMRDRLKDKAPY